MRELDEALMDRTTASLNRRQKITSIKSVRNSVDPKEPHFIIEDMPIIPSVDNQSDGLLSR
jgi:hypothetical protein